jgi:hypothetical protein
MVMLAECNNPLTLMESGVIPTAQAELADAMLYRGMIVLDEDGRALGRVAAVMVMRTREKLVARQFLLCKDHPSHYRQIAVEFIETVSDGKIQLQLAEQVVDKLPLWRGA